MFFHKHPKRWKIFLTMILLLLFSYIVLVYFIVSAALVPSFMEKLDLFEDITVQSYAAMVQTDEIHQNRDAARQKTKEWLQEVDTFKVQMTDQDGFKLIAQQFNAPENTSENAHRWALVLHGYTGWKEEMFEFACHYNEEGYNVLVPDLRCQGESEGDFIGMGWTDHFDCLEWLDYILDQDPEANIMIHGQSMGAATALIMTGDPNLPEQVKAVVSDASYTDGYSMFADKAKEWLHLPAFPLVDSARLMLMARGGYDLNDASPLEAVKKSHTPILLIHGDQDEMIPVESAYELYDAAFSRKEMLIVEGAGHAQTQQKDPELYYGTIDAFLASCYNNSKVSDLD